MLLLLLTSLPPVVVEVARLKLPPRQPVSLKGASVESYMVKPIYEDQITRADRRNTGTLGDYSPAVLRDRMPVALPIFQNFIQLWHLAVSPVSMREVDLDRACGTSGCPESQETQPHFRFP